MGRNENIKRMKKMRSEKRNRNQVSSLESKLDAIAAEATNSLLKKIAPYNIVTTNKGPIKYSEVLKDFVSPYMIKCRDFNAAKKLLTIGAMVWNLAHIKQSKGNKAYENTIKELEIEFKNSEIGFKVADISDFLMELIDRKIKYFSHHKILYNNVEIIENPEAIGISVAVIELD